MILKFEGEIAPVPFAVPMKSLFGFSFLVSDEKQVKQTDRMITRHRAFSLTPEVGIAKYIGRLLKVHIAEEGTIYAFMVDEIRIPKKARKVD